MNSTTSQALNVFQDAEERLNLRCASRVDEVVVALWEAHQDHSKTIREMALKIAMLEMKEAQPPLPAGEYAKLLGRLGSKP